MNVLITLTFAGPSTGPFSLFTDVDNYTTPFVTGVTRSSLISGYTTSLVPDNAFVIRCKSTGICLNYIDIPIENIPTPTPTVTTTLTSTPTKTPTPSITATPTITKTPTTTLTVTPTNTPTISITPSNTATPSVTPSLSLTPTTTQTPSVTPTRPVYTYSFQLYDSSCSFVGLPITFNSYLSVGAFISGGTWKCISGGRYQWLNQVATDLSRPFITVSQSSNNCFSLSC